MESTYMEPKGHFGRQLQRNQWFQEDPWGASAWERKCDRCMANLLFISHYAQIRVSRFDEHGLPISGEFAMPRDYVL